MSADAPPSKDSRNLTTLLAHHGSALDLRHLLVIDGVVGLEVVDRNAEAFRQTGQAVVGGEDSVDLVVGGDESDQVRREGHSVQVG